MNWRGQSRQQAAALQALRHSAWREPCAMLPGKQRQRQTGCAGYWMGQHTGQLGAHRQPMRQCLHRGAAQRHTAAFAALALHLHLGVGQVNPAAPGAGSVCAGHHIQTRQLCDAQTAAIKQLDHRSIPGFKPRVVVGLFVVGQLHRFVHAQGFGQRLAHTRRTHIGHRVERNQAFQTQPCVKTAPARQNECNAPPAAPGVVHLRHPTAHMTALHLQQRHLRVGCH